MTRVPRTCDVCGCERFEMVYSGCPDRRHWVGEAFDVTRCLDCGCGQTRPRLTSEELTSYYPSRYASFVSVEPARGTLARWARLLVDAPYMLRYGRQRGAPPAGPTSHRLLDVGSGTGDFLAAMRQQGWEVWGIEPDPRAAAISLQRLGLGPERIHVGLAEEASYAHGSFDVITLNHVLEHLHQPGRVLEAAAAWLREGGELWLRLPNFDSLERRVFGQFWFGLDLPRHLNHFSRRSLIALLVQHGFSVESLRPELQTATLTGSVIHVRDELLRRRRAFRHSGPLYYGLRPLGSILLALGSSPTLEVAARRASSS